MTRDSHADGALVGCEQREVANPLEPLGRKDDGGGARSVTKEVIGPLVDGGAAASDLQLVGMDKDEHALARVALLDAVYLIDGDGITAVATQPPDGVGGIEYHLACPQSSHRLGNVFVD